MHTQRNPQINNNNITYSHRLVKQSFRVHLRELQTRFLLWLLIFGTFSLIGYTVRERLIAVLVLPLKQPLFYTSPAGGFDFIFKMSIFFGFICSLPLLIYQLFKYIQPVLPRQNSQQIVILGGISILLTIIGVTFAYSVSLPGALFFLNQFETNTIQSLISTDAYFSFVSRYLVGFALLFQMPLVLFFTHMLHPLSIRMLLSKLKFVIVISFIIAAILTPTPDFINQIMMAMPIIGLYLLSIFCIVIYQKHKSQR